MPDKIADAMCAHCPGAEDEFFVPLLKLGEEFFNEVIGFAWVTEVEAGADGIFDIDPVALTDAEDDSGELGEIIERVLDEREVVIFELGAFVGERLLDRGGERDDIAGEENFEPEFFGKDIEQGCKLFTIERNVSRDFRFVEGMGGEVCEVVECDGVVT